MKKWNTIPFKINTYCYSLFMFNYLRSIPTDEHKNFLASLSICLLKYHGACMSCKWGNILFNAIWCHSMWRQITLNVCFKTSITTLQCFIERYDIILTAVSKFEFRWSSQRPSVTDATYKRNWRNIFTRITYNWKEFKKTRGSCNCSAWFEWITAEC